MEDPDLQIETLLFRLNRWQHMSGIDPQEISDVRSTGESNAAIERLKHELDQLGAHYHWDPDSRAYRLDTWLDATGEEE